MVSTGFCSPRVEGRVLELGMGGRGYSELNLMCS